MTNESRYIWYSYWSDRASSAWSTANREVDAINSWIKRYKRCLKNPLYPAVVCTKVRETLENKVKSAKETMGWIEAVIKDAERVWINDEDELERLMTGLYALASVKEKLQRAIDEASNYLGLTEGKEGGQGE